MAKKLTEDEIKWILSIESTQAQQEAHRLEKANRELAKTNRDLTKSMHELVAEGRKDSEAYRNLEAEVKANTRTIGKNKSAIDELVKSMGLNALTMNQLRKRAGELRNQMNNTSAALHPEAYAKLDAELGKVTGRMDELRSSGQKTLTILGREIRANGAVAVFTGNLWMKALEWVSRLKDKVAAFISEGVEMARVAEGVERAFERLNDPSLLDDLKRATRDTVDELSLMKLSVQANNFKIPLENLATYFRFARQRARETGESVDYLVDSIVTGIGRKSPLILDNLGISVVALRDKLSETGDFARAAGLIIEEELAKSDELFDTSADKAAARAAELKNRQLEIGKVMKGIYESVSTLSTGAVVGVINTFIKFKDVLISLTAAVVAYTVATRGKAAILAIVDLWNNKILKSTIALTIKEKLHTLSVHASTIATTAKALAHDVLAKKITLAAAAQKALHFAFTKTPWGLVIAAVAAIGVYLYQAAQKTRELSAEQQSLRNIAQKTTERFAEQKAKIDMLAGAIENENLSNEMRRQKINELKEIMPGYNGSLDEEGKLINHNSEAIREYLKLLQKQIELKATEEERLEISKKMIRPQMKLDEANEVLEDPYYKPLVSEMKQLPSEKRSFPAGSSVTHKLSQALSQKKAAEKEIAQYDQQIAKLDTLVVKRMEEIDKLQGQTKATRSLIEAKKEELREAELLPESTEAEIAAKNKKIASIEAEISRLQKLGVETGKAEKEKEKAEKAREKAAKERQEAEEESDKAALESMKEPLSKQLTLLESARNARLEQLQEEESDQNVYAIRAAEIETRTAELREAVIRKHGEAIAALELHNNQLRLEAIEENGEAIVKAEAAVLEAREKQRRLFHKTAVAIEKQYNIKTWEERKADELAILKKQYEEKLLLEETYQSAVKAIEEKYKDEKKKREDEIYQIRMKHVLVSLKEQYKKEKEELDDHLNYGKISIGDYLKARVKIWQDYQNQLVNEEMKIIQAGINAAEALEEAETASVSAEYEKRQAALTEQYNRGLISQEAYNEEKGRLDYEQKVKELEVQKKYADVNFAMQVAQILATTAQGIITAWSTSMKLGPIAGPIAAAAMSALLGLTSAAQIGKANSERERVKAMTIEKPGGSGASTGKRVLTGKAGGGYMDVVREQDGRAFRAEFDPHKRGMVRKPTVIVGEEGEEWVASGDAMKNPTVRPILQFLNTAQEKGVIRTIDMNQMMRRRLSGFAGGGFIGSEERKSGTASTVNGVDTPPGSPDIQTLNQLLVELKRTGLKAYVVLSDLQRMQELDNKSKSIGGKS